MCQEKLVKSTCRDDTAKAGLFGCGERKACSGRAVVGQTVGRGQSPMVLD